MLARCINNSYLDGGTNYSDRLTIGKIYIIITRSSSTCCVVIDDRGRQCQPFIKRFKKLNFVEIWKKKQNVS